MVLKWSDQVLRDFMICLFNLKIHLYCLGVRRLNLEINETDNLEVGVYCWLVAGWEIIKNYERTLQKIFRENMSLVSKYFSVLNGYNATSSNFLKRFCTQKDQIPEPRSARNIRRRGCICWDWQNSTASAEQNNGLHSSWCVSLQSNQLSASICVSIFNELKAHLGFT